MNAARQRPIPTYLSHSYRIEDRHLNEAVHDLFWENGFAFTVDPKSGSLSTTHLEMMMVRNACFVGVVTRRDEEEYYCCSPFAVYEYGLAVRAHKPRLLLLERSVPRHYFPDRDAVYFDGNHVSTPTLRAQMQRLKRESLPYAYLGARPLGDVGLLLPDSAEYAEATPFISRALSEAGYTPRLLSLHEMDEADGATVASTVDSLDFVVVDISENPQTNRLVSFIFGRFTPSLKLVHHHPDNGPFTLPKLVGDRALEAAATSAEVAIWWSTPDGLYAEMRRRIRRLHTPRREFQSKSEGQAYFRSLGQARGPVFVSSARDDNELARAVVNLLGSYNITPFHYLHNNTLPLGEEWQPALEDNLRSSAIFAPLISRSYWMSKWCQQELQTAMAARLESGLRVIPIIVDHSNGHNIDVQGISVADTPEAERASRIVKCIDRDLIEHGRARSPILVGQLGALGPVPDVDIAVVTVLDVEYKAMLAHLEGPQLVPGTRAHPNQHAWVTGWITNTRGSRYHVVLGIGQQGNEKSAITTQGMVDAFRPEYVLLVGIAGAISKDLALGDVVVSDRVCGYEHGALYDGFVPRPDWSYPANQAVAAAARVIDGLCPDWSKSIKAERPKASGRAPQAFVGQIASGNKVVDNLGEASFQAVLEQWPLLLAVEMEGLGGVLAVDDARERGITTYFSMIRGISDQPPRPPAQPRAHRTYQSGQRNLWKARAAAAAAALTTKLIQTAWPTPPQSESAADV